MALTSRERAASSPEFVANGDVIRDPQLDRYLLAHKQFSGSTVLGATSGFLRNAVAEVPAR
jgi:sigma-E factor negative regulatory protein RseA